MHQYDIQFAGALGGPELLIIFGIVVLLFGGSKLPVLGRSLGEGISNFKKSFKGGDDEEIAIAEVAPPAENAEAIESKPSATPLEDQSAANSSSDQA